MCFLNVAPQLLSFLSLKTTSMISTLLNLKILKDVYHGVGNNYLTTNTYISTLVTKLFNSNLVDDSNKKIGIKYFYPHDGINLGTIGFLLLHLDWSVSRLCHTTFDQH